MTMDKIKAATCPNCNRAALRKGKVITCEHCDASFRFTQEGPKISEIGPLESRLKTIEEKLGIGAAAEPPETEPDTLGDDADEPEENNDEDGI